MDEKKKLVIFLFISSTLQRLWVEMMAEIGDSVGESQSEILIGEALTTCWSKFVQSLHFMLRIVS